MRATELRGDSTPGAETTAAQAEPANLRSGLLDTLMDRLIGPRGCFLTFHRAARRAEWLRMLDQGFTLELERLDALIGQLIRAGWDIVTVEEALAREKRDGRFVNFSIDDAYLDTWELIVPLFRRHGVPVTVFVTTGIPDGGYELWSVGLETILMERSEIVVRGKPLAVPDRATKLAALQDLRRDWEASGPVARYHAFCADNEYDPAGLHARHAITWDMLRSFGGDRCVEIGAHTLTHPNISILPADAALTEMQGSRMRLEEQLGLPVRHFAFPFGRRTDCGPRDFALAREAGFSSSATTRKGLLRGNSRDPYQLPRNTLNGTRMGDAAIQAHLTGVSGALARITRRD